MRIKFAPWILLLLLAFVACPLEDCDSPSSATQGGGETTTTTPPAEPPPAPPRVDVAPMFGTHLAGFTAFHDVETYDPALGYETLAAFNGQYIVRKLIYMRSRGYNLARVGAQTDGWCDNDAFYLLCGTTPYTERWYENLRGFLALSSRVEGMWIQLIPTLTHKGDSCGKPCLVRLTKEVVRIAQEGGYKHIIWEAFNEFSHGITRDGGNFHEPVLRAVLRELPHPRGTDLPGNRWTGDRWRGNPNHPVFEGVIGLMDYVAYHPSRNPEPTEKAYRRTIQLSRGKPVLWDETVSWITELEAGTLGARRRSFLFTQGTQEEMDRQVRNQRDTICRAGGSYSFHALWLFSYDERLDWAPMVGC